MKRTSATIFWVLLLGACALTGPKLSDWVSFMDDVDRAGAVALETRIDAAQIDYGRSPDDPARLRLAYLLGSRASDGGEIDESLAMLDGVSANSAYAPVRDLMRDRISLKAQVRELEGQLRESERRIAALGDESSRVPALEARVRELQAQLDALKSIETDITEDQRLIQDMAE